MLKFVNKLIASIIVITIAILLIMNTNSNAKVNNLLSANLKSYKIETDKSLIDSGYDYSRNSNTLTYVTPNQSYDFIDENGTYNSVYITKNDVFWSKFDKNMNITKTVSWPLYYNINNEENAKAAHKMLTYNFANAIYYNKYLYVMYSRIANGATQEEHYAEKVMALVKYDNNGKQIKAKEYSGVELNPSYNYDNEGTSVPFYGANCSLAVNNGILACFFGRNMYMSHQSSMIAFFDLESLEYVSNQRNNNLSTEIQARYYYVTTHYISHSLGQRIIPTSDGQFLMMEQGDAGYRGNTRGLLLTKIYEEHDSQYNLDILKEKTLRMTHFSEGGKGSNGYNWLYNVLGGLVEVNDGYIYVGAMEKTLSRAYGNSINEERNLFVQKYSKDFYQNKTAEQAQMLSTKVRTATGEPAESNGYGRLYLTGDEKDYGMKWLTDLDKKAITVVRTVKTEDNKIVVLWEQVNLKEYEYKGEPQGYTAEDIRENRDVYYMILDKNANIIQEATKIPNVYLSIEEQYAYKNGKIYWTTTGEHKTMTINGLDIKNPIKGLKGDVNGDGKVNIKDWNRMYEHISGKSKLNEEELYRGDVNDDEKVNIKDWNRLYEHISGKKLLW